MTTVPNSIRLLDVGCGTGRNLHHFLRGEFRVFAVDLDVDALGTARSLFARSGSTAGPFFAAAHSGNLPFRGEHFATVLCFDLLHWARDSTEFESWWREIWRTLKPGGILCARFRCRSGSDSSVGEKTGKKWHLADQVSVTAFVDQLGGEWVEPWMETPLKGGGRNGNAIVRRKI